MGWNIKAKTKDKGKEEGIKIGFWNKGGALQPLKEKINEIENMIKTNNFGVFGVIEANFLKDNDKKDVQLDGFTIFWDRGRENQLRRNSRCVLYVRSDLSYKLRLDLMNETCPEIWIEIREARKKRSLLCLYYR